MPQTAADVRAYARVRLAESMFATAEELGRLSLLTGDDEARLAACIVYREACHVVRSYGRKPRVFTGELGKMLEGA